jgi:Fe-S-cluster containining protein
MRIIERALSTAGIPIETPFVTQGYTFPRETADGCVFFDTTTKRCRIQSVKPALCVAYSVTFDINLNEGTIEWYLHTEEVCPLSGALTRSKALFTQHLESAKREITAFVRGLQHEELRTVLAIEVPAAVKIDEDPIDSAVLERLKHT